jgi:elongation factor Ts
LTAAEEEEEVTPAVLEHEKEIARERARAEGKPEKMLDKIVEGKMSKFYEEVCLLDQPFIKDNTLTVAQLIATVVGKLGENITVARFARMKVGGAAAQEPAGENDGQ